MSLGCMTNSSGMIVWSIVSVKSGVKSYVGEVGKSMKAAWSSLIFSATFARCSLRTLR
jgi:hypothetical protein